MSYTAPLKDMQFVLNELADLAGISALPGCEDATPETVEAVIEENAKFCSEVIAPLNVTGDREPSSWRDSQVTTTKGFKEAFKAFGDAGWQGVQHPVEYGGQGLPEVVATPCMEMLNAANLSFALCPLLTDGAIEALMTAGTKTQQETYIANFISGKWTGTMNLTEPQAGSDLALVRTKAVPQGDGTYKLFGTKIFITYGEHDLSENILHLVLARTPDAPEGVKGISLFLVPKYLVNADGSLGARNTARCASIEHKLGIHASPTAVMVYEDAVGYLVGEENRGLETMFIMMNAARFAVGLEGVAIAERAFQRALAFAKERLQGRDLVAGGKAVPIIRHPDVRRMLMLMKSQTEAMRALAYTTAAAMDFAGKTQSKVHQAYVDLMIPVVKGWSTETGIDVASLGVQVHGGMGFVEETGAAQYLRDARITTIYEGTTGIQAMDLVGRKIARDGGATAKAWLAEVRKVEKGLPNLAEGVKAVEDCVEFIVASKDPRAPFAGAVPFLKLMGIVAGGWQMARATVAAEKELSSPEGDSSFFKAKLATARFYGEHVLSQAPALRANVLSGADAVMAIPEDQFLAA